MADALQTLLGLNSPTNMNAVGAAYTPNVSRNNVRVSALRRALGLPGQDDGSNSQQDYETAYQSLSDEQDADLQKKAEAATLPERVRGEYGLAAEHIRAEGQKAALQAQMERFLQQQATTTENQRLNREAIDARSAANRSAIDQRTAGSRDAVNSRQTAGRNEVTARLYDQGKAHAPRPANEGLLSRWIFGPSQSDLDRKEAERLRGGGAPAAAGGNDLAAQAGAQYAAQYGHLGDEELRAVIAQTQPTATPDEQEAIFFAARGGQ
jgi:hypothetical protein